MESRRRNQKLMINIVVFFSNGVFFRRSTHSGWTSRCLCYILHMFPQQRSCKGSQYCPNDSILGFRPHGHPKRSTATSPDLICPDLTWSVSQRIVCLQITCNQRDSVWLSFTVAVAVGFTVSVAVAIVSVAVSLAWPLRCRSRCNRLSCCVAAFYQL